MSSTIISTSIAAAEGVESTSAEESVVSAITTNVKKTKSKKKAKKGKKEKKPKIPKDVITNERGELVSTREYTLEKTLEATSKSLSLCQQRMEGLARTNEELQENLQQQEKDALEVIAALQRENDKKDAQIRAMRDEMIKMAEKYEKQRLTLVEESDKKISNINAILNEKEAAYKVMQQEFSVIKDFRRKRHELMKELEYQKMELADTERRHREVITRMERKFFEEKIRLQKEANQKISELAAKAHKEAVLNLKETTKEVYKENMRMAEALRYHVEEGQELNKMNAELTETNRQLVEEKDLQNVIVKEKILQTKTNEKAIRDLHNKIQSMEHSLSHVVREFEHERDLIGTMAKKELDEVRLVAERLRARLTRKTMEMRHIKRLAQHILDQRTHVEEFFFDAMEYVKKQIKKERDSNQKLEQAEYQQRMRQILQNKGAIIPKSKVIRRQIDNHLSQRNEHDTLPTTVKSKIDISELEWEDKEKILRLLFAQMNGTPLTKAVLNNTKSSKTEEVVGNSDSFDQLAAVELHHEPHNVANIEDMPTVDDQLKPKLSSSEPIAITEVTQQRELSFEPISNLSGSQTRLVQGSS